MNYLIEFVPACTYTAKALMENHYNTFLDLIKHSQTGNTFTSEAEMYHFEEKYVNTTTRLNNMTKRAPKYLKNEIGSLPFCETASTLRLSSISKESLTKCRLFEYLITPKGIIF